MLNDYRKTNIWHAKLACPIEKLPFTFLINICIYTLYRYIMFTYLWGNCDNSTLLEDSTGKHNYYDKEEIKDLHRLINKPVSGPITATLWLQVSPVYFRIRYCIQTHLLKWIKEVINEMSKLYQWSPCIVSSKLESGGLRPVGIYFLIVYFSWFYNRQNSRFSLYRDLPAYRFFVTFHK